MATVGAKGLNRDGVLRVSGCLSLLLLTVPEGVRARALLVFRDGPLHPTQPVLRRHQEARVSTPGRRQAIHGPILAGNFTCDDSPSVNDNLMHRCKKRFLRFFTPVTFLRFLTFFFILSTFFI